MLGIKVMRLVRKPEKMCKYPLNAALIDFTASGYFLVDGIADMSNDNQTASRSFPADASPAKEYKYIFGTPMQRYGETFPFHPGAAFDARIESSDFSGSVELHLISKASNQQKVGFYISISPTAYRVGVFVNDSQKSDIYVPMGPLLITMAYEPGLNSIFKINGAAQSISGYSFDNTDCYLAGKITRGTTAAGDCSASLTLNVDVTDMAPYLGLSTVCGNPL